MKIYSPEASTPAAAITLATAASNTQPILFTNHFGDTGIYSNETQSKEVKLEWVLKEILVSLTRDWGTSQAQITLTCELSDQAMFLPHLPDVSFYRGGDYPYLDREDEIRIYAGYVESSNTPITSDLLDEIPFDFTDVNTKILQTHNPEKPLCPIFWGFIDNIKLKSTSNGFSLTLQCRDRTRVFADTRIVNLQALSGELKKDNNEAQNNDANLAGIASGDRSAILLQLANAASGNPFGENLNPTKDTPKCWRFVKEGMIVKGYTFNNGVASPNFPEQDPAEWVQTATCRILNEKANPRFNIWTEKPPILKGGGNATLQVLNKVPMEIIDYLAKTEARPMDFFASHINGDFIMGPRVKDESGFNDSHRQFRTYFHRTYPKESKSPPNFNAMIQSMEVISSSLFSFNNFVIVDSSTTKGSATSLIGSLRFGYSVLDPKLTNRLVSPPCKTQLIYDGGLAMYDNQEYGALLIALANARIFSRDTQGIEFEVVGDPTFCPGEAIRVYNTYLHDYKTYTIVDSQEDNNINDSLKQQEYKNKQVATAIRNQKPDDTYNTDKSNVQSKFINKAINNSARLPSDINNLVLPYYTVRVIQHRLTCQGDKGYKTSISASADI